MTAQMLFLEGEKTYLRPVEEADLERLWRWFHDPHLAQDMMSASLPLSRPQLREQILPLHPGASRINFAICLRETDVLLGLTCLRDVSWIERCTRLELLLGEQEAPIRGVGSEVTMMMLQYAFDSLNLHRVALRLLASNTRAQKGYVRLGFREEGRLRKRRFVRGAYVDELIFSILREEWEAQLPAE